MSLETAKDTLKLPLNTEQLSRDTQDSDVQLEDCQDLMNNERDTAVGSSMTAIDHNDDEEYFEEFHLPNTHEKTFVRHNSFRKKVLTTPIHVPDADTIEGIVRTGELYRHNSIRRKVLSEVDEVLREEEDEEDDSDCISLNAQFEKDICEIEDLLKREELEGKITGGEEEGKEGGERENTFNLEPEKNGALFDLNSVIGCSGGRSSSSNTHTSTPIQTSTSASSPFTPADLSMSLIDVNGATISGEDVSLSIEESTMLKVQQCLDFSRYKDIYNLSGRLQDILSPKEIEEVLTNSDRYKTVLDEAVIQVLTTSLQERSASPEDVKKAQNSDSGFSSPKRASSGPADVERSDSQLQIESDTLYPTESVNEGILQHHDIQNTMSEKDQRLSPAGGKIRIEAPAFVSDASVEDTTATSNCSSIDSKCLTLHREEQGVPEEATSPFEPFVRSVSEYETSLTESEHAFNMSIITSSTNTYEHSPIRILEETKKKRICVDVDLNLPQGFDNVCSSTSEFTDEHKFNPHISHSNINIPQHIPPNVTPPYPSSSTLEAMPSSSVLQLPQYTAAEEAADDRHWRNVLIGNTWWRIDMKVIQPYKQCIKHEGYLQGSNQAVILLNSASLPPRNTRNYDYVMKSLLLFVLSFLEQLITDDYIMVFLARGGKSGSTLGFVWLREAYKMIERKLRKNLQQLLVVHPTMWVRTLVAVSRPFISSKFYRKIKFVPSLTELAQIISLQDLDLPESVIQIDFELMSKRKRNTLNTS